MARRAQALDAILLEVAARWPGRQTARDGWIGDESHQSRASDHNPNAAGHVLAIDVDERWRLADELVGRWLWAALLRVRDPRLAYQIYEGQMASSYPAHGYPAWTPRPYTGPNAHAGHLHVSTQRDPALYDDPAPWRLNDQGPPVRGPIYYAEGRDVAAASAYVAASRRGLFTGDPDEAAQAAAAGVRVVAVGGPADDTLARLGVPHTAARGDNGTATYLAVPDA